MRSVRSMVWQWGRRVVLVTAPALTLSALAEEIGEREPQRYDTWILASHFHFEPLVVTLAVFSLLGGGLGLLILTALPSGAFAMQRRNRAAMFLIAAVIGAEVIDRIFKGYFGRPRPAVTEYHFSTSLRVLLYGAIALALAYGFTTRWRRVAIFSVAMFAILIALDGAVTAGLHLRHGLDSFPSGHAVGSMALIAACSRLAWNTRHRWTVIAGGALFVALVGVSRVYLGYHYLSDVIAGWCLALGWVALISVIVGKDVDRPLSDLPRGPLTGALV